MPSDVVHVVTAVVAVFLRVQTIYRPYHGRGPLLTRVPIVQRRRGLYSTAPRGQVPQVDLSHIRRSGDERWAHKSGI